MEFKITKNSMKVSLKIITNGKKKKEWVKRDDRSYKRSKSIV